MSQSEAVRLWRERLRRFASSPMTVSQFCLSEGVSQASFYKWKKKLRELSENAKSKPSTTTAPFMPLRLAAESADQVVPISEEHVGPSLTSTTIDLPGGVRIRVEVPTDRQSSQRWEARI